MRRLKKVVCLLASAAILSSNSAMAAESIRIGGYLDQTGEVLMLVLKQNSDKDNFVGSDIAHIQQQTVDGNGYFTMDLPLLDNEGYDFYSNAQFKTPYSSTVRSGSVYVSSAGSDENDGKSEDAPMGTLAAALKVAAKLNYEKVVLLSDMDYADCPVSYSGTITIEGKTGAEKLNIETNSSDISESSGNVTRKYIKLVGDTTFSNLVLTGDTDSSMKMHIFAYGHALKIDENVTTQRRFCVFGGKLRAAMDGDTHVTVLGGKYEGIWGGGLSGAVNGDTYVTVGGTVNEGDDIDDSNDSTISPCYIWGGCSNASVTGDTHVTIKDSAVAKYVCGSGEQTKGKEKNTYVNIEGSSKVMNVYGGSAKSGAADLEDCNTHITMTGGHVESIFGGSEQNAMTGNVYIYLKGGEVKRRVYTGCYNEYKVFGGGWQKDNYVKGTTNLIISPESALDVNTKSGLSGTNAQNVGVFAGSRTAARHSDEKNTIIYMGGCMNTYKSQIGDKSNWGSTFKSFENYVVDAGAGGTVEPVSAGVLRIIPDDGNVAYVDDVLLQDQTCEIGEKETSGTRIPTVIEFSKTREMIDISIDYDNEELTGFEEGGRYAVNGTDIELTNNKYPISSVIADTPVTLLIVKKGDGVNTDDSTAQALTIPARPAAPDVTGIAPTVSGGMGKLIGTTIGMQYKEKDNNEDEWHDCTAAETEVTANKTYIVREKAVTEGETKKFASMCAEVELQPVKFSINSLTAANAENDGINVTANIGVGSDTENGPHTIIAIYDDSHKLVGVQLDYSMDKGVFNFDYRFESNKRYTIQAMIWNNSFKPLVKSYPIYFTKP